MRQVVTGADAVSRDGEASQRSPLRRRSHDPHIERSRCCVCDVPVRVTSGRIQAACVCRVASSLPSACRHWQPNSTGEYSQGLPVGPSVEPM